MTGFKDALSWKERCGEGARAFLQAAFFCTLSAHITTYHNRYTIIHSDTTQVDQDLLQFPVAQEILRCFPVATCFSLSQTFTIMAYSSGATLTCQNFMNFVIYAYLIYLRSLRNMCVCAHLHTNDPALCISQWCAFSRDVWSLLEPFRLRDTIFACVRSVEWRTRSLAALQLWVFGCFQNMSNVCS